MISVCMIVKNEGIILEKTLESIKRYGFELIIVDTGSTDNTIEIAKKYTDNVYDFNWCNDFSSARNYSIDKANSEFILVIDADERITSIDTNELEKAIRKNKTKVGRLVRNNRYTRNDNKFNYKERVNRFFSKAEFQYQGSIHEQVVLKSGEPYSTYNIPITIEHFGYEENEVTRNNKINRNIELLEKELVVNGDDPYILYQLGNSYYMDEKYQVANNYFSRALDFDLDTNLEYVCDLIESYGYALINDKKFEEAMKLLNVYEEFKYSADFIFLAGLIYMNNGLFTEAINEFKKAITCKECKMEGVNDYLANYNIGIILECLGNKEEAKVYYKKCKNYKLAQDRILNC